ncbi:YqzE family protein [Camelliibacillus cellulosilyticus]|uniref:YqzE family protein n=1 Tax=Camelliibacillus cellulosilyticus TaxID=2174486 RepID=A0ABV9GI61_9BACL
MKSDDYVKFLTEQFVKYMNQPRNERKQRRASRKQHRGPMLNEWFGLIPAAMAHTFHRLKKIPKARSRK